MRQHGYRWHSKNPQIVSGLGRIGTTEGHRTKILEALEEQRKCVGLFVRSENVSGCLSGAKMCRERKCVGLCVGSENVSSCLSGVKTGSCSASRPFDSNEASSASHGAKIAGAAAGAIGGETLRPPCRKPETASSWRHLTAEQRQVFRKTFPEILSEFTALAMLRSDGKKLRVTLIDWDGSNASLAMEVAFRMDSALRVSEHVKAPGVDWPHASQPH